MSRARCPECGNDRTDVIGDEFDASHYCGDCGHCWDFEPECDDELDDDELDDEPQCPSCGAPGQTPMGTLGRTAHYRCRSCGQMWHVSDPR